MNEKEYIQVKFQDKKFRIQARQPNEPQREIILSGSEAREVYNQLNKMINTRPRSEDDRISLEKGE